MNIDDIIMAWKMKYGKTRYPNSYRKFIPYGDRFILLCHLVRTLKEQFKYDRESFTDEIRQKIIDSCVNHGSTNFRSIVVSQKATKDDLEKVLFKIFPVEIQFSEERQDTGIVRDANIDSLEAVSEEILAKRANPK